MHLLIVETLGSPLHNQRCLATLEPRLDVAMLSLTLVTSSGRLALAGRGTTTESDALVVSSLVVAEAGEDGGIAGADGQAGEEGDEARGVCGGAEGAATACRSMQRRYYPWRHCEGGCGGGRGRWE